MMPEEVPQRNDAVHYIFTQVLTSGCFAEQLWQELPGDRRAFDNECQLPGIDEVHVVVAWPDHFLHHARKATANAIREVAVEFDRLWIRILNDSQLCIGRKGKRTMRPCGPRLYLAPLKVEHIADGLASLTGNVCGTELEKRPSLGDVSMLI